MTTYYVTKRNRVLTVTVVRAEAERVMRETQGSVLHYTLDGHVPKAVTKTVNWPKMRELYAL